MSEVERTAMKAGYPGVDADDFGKRSGQQSTGGPQAGAAGKYTLRPIDGRTKLLKVLLAVGAALAAVAVVSSLMQLQLLSRASFSEGQAFANDLREQLVGLAQLALFVVTAVIFGCWIVRAQKNVRALGATGLRIGPGWAVGYFFIPVVNLWRPYQAMKDLWLASHSPAEWRGTRPPAILSNWWGLWIVSNLLSRLASQLSTHAEGLRGIQAATCVQVGAGVVGIFLCLTAMRLVWQIAGAQTAHARRMTRPQGGDDRYTVSMMPRELEHAGV